MADDKALEDRNEFFDYGVTGKLIFRSEEVATQMPLGFSNGFNVFASQPTLPIHIEKSGSVCTDHRGSCLFNTMLSNQRTVRKHIRRKAIQFNRRSRMDRYQHLLTDCDEFEQSCVLYYKAPNLIKEQLLLERAKKLEGRLARHYSSEMRESVDILDAVIHADENFNEIACGCKFNAKVGNALQVVQFDGAVLVAVVSGQQLNKISKYI